MDGSFAQNIAALVKSARETGQPQKISLDKWTRLKAVWRVSGPAFQFWKITGTLPSKRNCDALALAAGIIAPAWKQWLCEGTDGLFMTDKADHARPCAHEWGGTTFADGKSWSGIGGTCQICGVVKMTVSSRRKSTKSGYEYDGAEVSQDAYAAFVVSGPIPHALDAEARSRILARLSARPGVLRLEPSQTPERQAAAAFTGRVCGLCEFGEVSEFLDVECGLGWDSHDPVMKVSVKDASLPLKQNGQSHYKDVRVAFAHGEAVRPILAPQTRCMCRTDSFKPFKGPPDPNRARMFADRLERMAQGRT